MSVSSLVNVVKVECVARLQGVRVGVGDVPHQLVELNHLMRVPLLLALPRVVLAGHVEVAGHADDGGLRGQNLRDPLLVAGPLVVPDPLEYAVQGW